MDIGIISNGIIIISTSLLTLLEIVDILVPYRTKCSSSCRLTVPEHEKYHYLVPGYSIFVQYREDRTSYKRTV